MVDWNGKVYIYNGYSWSLLCEASGYYYCLEYLSTNDIWLGECYYGRIAHWDGNMFNYFSSNIYDIFDIGFINSDLVWFVGENGYIYYWDGSEITSVESSTNNDINSVIMISSSDGWAAGDGGVVLRYH